MIDFTHIKYGILIAIIAILFGGLMGLSFGCCEESIKASLNSSGNAALETKYQGDQAKMDKVVKKSWVYYKRAHFHSQTMGVIAIVFSLLVAWLKFSPRLQLGISLLSGLGSLGYGVFWLLSGTLAPGMGSTGAAKEAVGLIAQASGGAFFISGVAVFSVLIYKMFIQPGRDEKTT
jgi:hypothetical protein